MKTSESHPIEVDFLESRDFPVLGRLGMTFAPGKTERYGHGGHWNRNLGEDLGRLTDHYGIDTLVSLVESHEFELLKIGDLEGACGLQGIELVRFPIPDLSPPESVSEFDRLIGRIRKRLEDGRVVALHCRAGLGRTGLTAACAIVTISGGKIDGRQAIEMVRRARPGTIETLEQEEFVVDFAARRMSAD